MPDSSLAAAGGVRPTGRGASRPADALDTQRTLVEWWSGPAGLRWSRTWLDYLLRRLDVLINTLQECKVDSDASVARIEQLRDDVNAAGIDLDAPVEGNPLAAAYVDRIRAETELQDELARRRAAAYAGYQSMCAEHLDIRDDEGQWLRRRIERLQTAQTYWIAEPMATLVNAAYDSMPEHTLRPDDVPCPVGFMLVDGDALLSRRGWGAEEDRDPDLPPPGFSAVSWEPAVGAMLDDVRKDGVRITWWFDVRSLPPSYRSHMLIGGAQLVPHSAFWPYGETEPPETADADAAHGCRWLLAAWHMMTRPIASTERPPVERAARKRAVRAGMAEPAVSVVTLRHASRPSGAPARKVDWKARWVVRGFWRQQWYPSIKEHRPVWIDEHVKGPEDRPLAIRPRVYAWRR